MRHPGGIWALRPVVWSRSATSPATAGQPLGLPLRWRRFVAAQRRRADVPQRLITQPTACRSPTWTSCRFSTSGRLDPSQLQVAVGEVQVGAGCADDAYQREGPGHHPRITAPTGRPCGATGGSSPANVLPSCSTPAGSTAPPSSSDRPCRARPHSSGPHLRSVQRWDSAVTVTGSGFTARDGVTARRFPSPTDLVDPR